MCPADLVDAHQLIRLFDNVFSVSDETVLIGGANEPFYQPGSPHRIYFRADYLRSALHEVAHWSLAGQRRRELPDYGYWYSPEGRDDDQQQAFFMVEARPQAIERCFCEALGVAFSPSIDNVGAHVALGQLQRFEARIQRWHDQFGRDGLPPRAARFATALRSMASLSRDLGPGIAA